MRIAFIVGARPEFIQAEPGLNELRKKDNITQVHTGQYYDYELSKIFFEELNIPEPDYHLGVGAVRNLNRAGIFDVVYNVGDVMYDSLLRNVEIVEGDHGILNELKRKKYFLMTVHRPENTDNVKNTKNIMSAVIEAREKFVLPAHPRIMKCMEMYSIGSMMEEGVNIKIINPVGYLNFLRLLRNAKKVLTNSGGVQKQAYLLKTPCTSLRDTTEWIETVEDGWNVLVGTNKEKIIEVINNFKSIVEKKNVFGDGRASERICKIIKKLSRISGEV